ncbi:MAG: hypothetical protein RSC24_06275 [Clostridium sp.]
MEFVELILVVLSYFGSITSLVNVNLFLFKIHIKFELKYNVD